MQREGLPDLSSGQDGQSGDVTSVRKSPPPEAMTSPSTNARFTLIELMVAIGILHRRRRFSGIAAVDGAHARRVAPAVSLTGRLSGYASAGVRRRNGDAAAGRGLALLKGRCVK